jgi:type 1 glutamine amidotransferase
MVRSLKRFAAAFLLILSVFSLPLRADDKPKFRALAFYSTTVEKAHVQFAWDILSFYTRLSRTENFSLDATTDWSKMNAANLAKYQMILWINDSPHNDDQRAAFQAYMEHGGGWIGFHVAGYNDKDTHWPWFVDFLGGAVFYTNNWPVMPARLIVDSTDHPVTAHLPAAGFVSPANEFYQWRPSPRLNKDVKVLLTLDPANYPLGKKDLITEGDVPVVWTNTRYRMLYINMGHGFNILDDATQNRMFEDAIEWIGQAKPASTQPTSHSSE